MAEKGRFSEKTANLLPGHDTDPGDEKAGPEPEGNFCWSFH